MVSVLYLSDILISRLRNSLSDFAVAKEVSWDEIVRVCLIRTVYRVYRRNNTSSMFPVNWHLFSFTPLLSSASEPRYSTGLWSLWSNRKRDGERNINSISWRLHGRRLPFTSCVSEHGFPLRFHYISVCLPVVVNLFKGTVACSLEWLPSF